MRTKICLNLFLKGIICFVLPSLAAGQDNNTNGANVDMRFVRFNMFVNPTLSATDPKVLNGAVTHYFITKVPNVSTIKFDFYRDNSTNHLISDSIRYHGVKYNLTAANHVIDTLLVNLPAAIPASGTLDSVTIYYHGNPPQSSGSRGYKKATTASTNPIISTHSSGFFARQWWPCKHNMTDKIDEGVEFYITAPSAYKAVANGLLQDANPPIVNSTRTWHWKSNYPIAHYLIAMAVSDFTVYTSPSANVSGTTVPIISYLTLTANTAARRSNIDAMKNVIEHFSTLFGDYPWKNEKYGHVAYTFGGGMENQTASYIGETVFNDISTLAHELAHQWFGDKVTCSKWNHNWVNEGFARYAEILYSEKFETSSAVISKRASYKAGSGVQSSSNTIYRYDVEVVNDNTDHTGKIFVSSMVYNKASIVVSMLRKLVGDANFFQALRNFLNDPLVSFGYAATEDVRRHFEAVSGKDLTVFFDDFIYKAGYPTYNVQWEYSSSLKKVAIKLNQTKTVSGAYAVSGRFHTVLPIRLMKTTTPVKDTTIIVYDDGVQSLNTMGFNVSFVVDQIQVDPDSESYSYNNTVTKTAALATILPVDLYKFEAQRTGDNITLTWKSGNDVNFSHYEIEHSTDCVTFSKIGRVDHNPFYSEYQFVHRLPAAGRNYYRLKMIDQDGTYKFSSTAVVEIGFEQKVKAVPNPANDKITVLLPYPVINQTIPVKLINLREQVFQAVSAKTGGNSIELNVSNIPSGSYWIECTINNYKTVVRVLIQH